MIGAQEIKLKVCGMRDAANILAVASLRPDYMGFIFYPGSPRFVGENFRLPEGLDEVQKVGVFVNAGATEMLNVRDRLRLDVLQLHGNESPEVVKELKANGVLVFKVFSVGDSFDFTTVEPYVGYADYFLFDTKGKHYGGNARTFDWNLLKPYNQDVPFLLSGGINGSNIQDVANLSASNLFAVDINSGVEDSPGKKNIQKIMDVREELKQLKRKQLL
jgi:phosphoribosylanthranilate isomerase